MERRPCSLAGRLKTGICGGAGTEATGLVPDTRVLIALTELGDPAVPPSLSSWARGRVGTALPESNHHLNSCAWGSGSPKARGPHAVGQCPPPQDD